MIWINTEIDKNTKLFTDEGIMTRDLKYIKKKLDETSKLKLVLQLALAPMFTDLTRSHRQHYHSLLRHCFSLYEMEKNWNTINSKIENNVQSLNSVYLDLQEKNQKRQAIAMGLLNVILGAGIVFQILEYLFTDESTRQIVLQVVGGTFLTLLVLLVVWLYGARLIKKE